MSSRAGLERFRDTDPADVGCGQAMEILHVYVDRDCRPGRPSWAMAGLIPGRWRR
jgi:hypothetical protein